MARVHASLSDAVSHCGSRLGYCGEAGLPPKQCKTMKPLDPKVSFPGFLDLDIFEEGKTQGEDTPQTVRVAIQWRQQKQLEGSSF